jgi:NADH dehydrogenase
MGANVVVVGAGFGGLNAASALARAPVEVTLIDRDNYHGFSPLLYQVATAGLGPEDIAHPVRAIFARQPNVDVRLGTVTGVDLDRRLIEIRGEEPVGYDYLVLAAGSVTNDFGVPGVAAHGFPLKMLPDAMRLRNHVLACFERADAEPSLVDDGILTFVIAGGGPTGVEVAGALRELIGNNLASDFHRLAVGRARVLVVEMTDRLLGSFSSASQIEALHTLRIKGVEVHLDQAIASVGPRSVSFGDGTVIPTHTVIWTAGVRANPLVEGLDLAKGRGGAIQVGPDLSVPGHPDVFVIGDLASATDAKGRPAPQLAPVAIQGGRHVARCIERSLAGRGNRPFRYRDKGIMATIGRRSAVADLPLGIHLSGTLGWLSWLGVHLVFLIGFRNRAVVLLNWAWNYLTWDRGSRVILEEQDPPR